MKILSLLTLISLQSRKTYSSLEHKLRYFWWNLRAFWPSIDSNGTNMFKAQKGCKDIDKIVHVTSVVQPKWMKWEYFLCANKTKIMTFFYNFFSSVSVFDALMRVPWLMKALRFHQKYFNLCSEDEGLMDFDRHKGVNLWQNFHFLFRCSSFYFHLPLWVNHKNHNHPLGLWLCFMIENGKLDNIFTLRYNKMFF